VGYILLAEDDVLLVRLYQKKLKNDGYDVRVATNGEEALSETMKEKPDLVLLDIMMPKVNGMEVLRRLKSGADTKAIPVIVLTNLSSEEDAEKVLGLGAVAYLVKSDNPPDVVIAKVKEVLTASTRGKELPKAVPTGRKPKSG